jgi:hypothetical protein
MDVTAIASDVLDSIAVPEPNPSSDEGLVELMGLLLSKIFQ